MGDGILKQVERELKLFREYEIEEDDVLIKEESRFDMYRQEPHFYKLGPAKQRGRDIAPPEFVPPPPAYRFQLDGDYYDGLHSRFSGVIWMSSQSETYPWRLRPYEGDLGEYRFRAWSSDTSILTVEPTEFTWYFDRNNFTVTKQGTGAVTVRLTAKEPQQGLTHSTSLNFHVI